MEFATDCRIKAEFENRLLEGADAGELGKATGAVWRAISDQLSPVLGARGVASLYQRCLFVTGAQYVWLREISNRAEASEPAELALLFQNRSPHDAVAAATLLLNTLNELLASLVGASLTERLLRPVWNDFLHGTSTQGNTA